MVFKPHPNTTQTKQKTPKSTKILKFSRNDKKKKKRFYAIIHPMHVQCIKFQTNFNEGETS
ncbi:hypothetical protein N411_07360 [Helicobacter pylori FD535]|nr:hypothetical protein N411_07360 [Helicobacter pylori FD535]